MQSSLSKRMGTQYLPAMAIFNICLFMCADVATSGKPEIVIP